MSSPSVPAKPDASSSNDAPERRTSESPARREDSPAQGVVTGRSREAQPDRRGDEQPESSSAGYASASSDRAADADLLIDVPQLTVAELSLELEASFAPARVKLDAKELDAGLFVKANFDSLRALVQRGSDTPAASPRGSDVTRVRTGLRELLGATRDAYRDLSDGDVQRQLRGVHESAREAHDRVAAADERAPESGGADEDARGSERDHNGHGGRPHAVRERLRHAAGQGAKAAGLTAAGLAGGAILESRSKPSHKLPIPRRRNRAQVVLHEISRRLP